ncbi:MAG TPA: flagellar basal-body MS-ring/collar protein FliF [Clostridiales bacterium]|nr:flagellar basal-body MS-ring/collar protein FliF [Clostridiales bacterium]
MREQLKHYINSIVSFWKKQSKKNKTIILSLLAGIIIVSFVVVLLLNAQKYTVLYPSMDHDEALEVMAKLDEREVDYKEEDGTIMVPSDEEDSLRMDLANEGYPRSSPNYDFLLENMDLMTTEKEKELLEKYQLNQRMEDIIKTIDGIKEANVTINIPDDSGYVLSDDDSDVTTAGVSVTMSSSQELTGKQVSGIKHLLAKSVPNLTEDNISVLDTATGTEMLSDDMEEMDVSEFKLMIEKQFETEVEANIIKILKPLFGVNNIQVAVKSIMDVDKKIEEIITYTPTENNTGVISEETHSQSAERNDGTSGGTVGTDSNTETTTTYPGVTVDGNTIYIEDNSSYTYLVSQVKEQIEHDSSELTDLTISVAVNTQTLNTTEKDEIIQLIANAAAVPTEKVVLYTGLFQTEDTDESDDSSSVTTVDKNRVLILIIAAVAVIGTLLSLVIILLLKSKGRKKKAAESQEKAMDEPIDTIEDIDFSDIHNLKETKEQALKKEIQEFCHSNPEIVAQLIKTWLRGDDAND